MDSMPSDSSASELAAMVESSSRIGIYVELMSETIDRVKAMALSKANSTVLTAEEKSAIFGMSTAVFNAAVADAKMTGTPIVISPNPIKVPAPADTRRDAWDEMDI